MELTNADSDAIYRSGDKENFTQISNTFIRDANISPSKNNFDNATFKQKGDGYDTMNQLSK